MVVRVNPLRLARGWIAPTIFVTSAVLANAQQPVQPLAGAPLPGLTASELARFNLGKQAFEHSQTVAEGLGPIMNAAGYAGGCWGCHYFPTSGGGSSRFVEHFGGTSAGSGSFDPLTSLGGPIRQRLSINPGLFGPGPCDEVVPPQANLVIHRIAPPIFGFGLVEAIQDADIQVREAFPPQGVSGRANIVTPAETSLGPPRVGRFGWKSQVPTLLTFAGDEMVNELGITNRLFPLDNVPNGAPAASQPCESVPDPEDGPDAQGFHKIDRVADFMRFLAPPPQTPKSGMTGEALFDNIGCAKCHVSTPYTTIPTVLEVALQSRPLKPYSDFLLHDMGTLGDGFPEAMASALEFRTPPLWGVKFRAGNTLLHDGRIQYGLPEANLHAAILAHEGEAASIAAAYAALSTGDQLRIQKFLMSLGQGEFDYDGGQVSIIDDVDWFYMRLDVTGPGSFFDADDPRAIADFDADGDIDLRDIAGLQRAFTGT